MTFLESLLGRPSTAVAVRGLGQLENPNIPLTSATLIDLFAGPRVYAGTTVSETTSLGVTAVWRAVNLIAGTCAALPLGPYRADADGTPIPLQPSVQAAQLLAKPHPDLTPFELWEIVYTHLLLWGNAYLQILRNENGQVSELWPLHPSRVRPGRDPKTMEKVYLVDGNPDGTAEQVQQVKTDDSMLHLPGFGYDGIIGLSPIGAARQSIGLALAAEEFGARFFGNGALSSGVLQTERVLTPDQASNLTNRWRDKISGLSNAHSVAILDSGAKFEKLTIPPEEAQFLESRRFQIAEIARIYGVPPHLLMETDRSTSWGSGIEAQGIGFVTYTLQPYLTRIEQRITRILKPQPAYASYNVEGLLRGDSTQRTAFYKALWEMGVLSANDILRAEKKPLIPGPNGDKRFVPMNFVPLDQAGTTEPAPASTPEDAGAADPADDTPTTDPKPPTLAGKAAAAA